MDDRDLIDRIGELVDEEHDLEQHHQQGALSDAQQARMRSLEVQLDQCWDLLRQRRARRRVGEDPQEAAVRPESTVEHYQQ